MSNIKKLYEELNVRLEAPKPLGKNFEFFLQHHVKDSVATNSHIHSAIELIYVNEGDYVAILDGEEMTLHAGDLLTIPSNTVHFVMADSSDLHSYYVAKIPPTALIDYSDDANGIEYAMCFFDDGSGKGRPLRSADLVGTRVLAILDRLKEELHNESYASAVIIKIKTVELLIEILRRDKREQKSIGGEITGIMYTVLRYVNKHFAEDIDERVLAARVGVSYGYFVRAFKNVSGMSFRKYLNRVRLNNASQMLLCSSRDVSEVAIACGYNSVSYFISLYRREKGETPKETSARRISKPKNLFSTEEKKKM